jgi:5-methylcytosine-specific restriction protein A
VLCVIHQREGRIVPAEEIDHIVPISQGGAIWDEANWMAICKSHHSAKTLREQHAKRG